MLSGRDSCRTRVTAINRSSKRREMHRAKSATAGRSAEADRLVQQGLQLHQAGRLPHAEETYRRTLKAHPQHPAALHFLGLLLHQTGRTGEGLPLLAQSIAAEPDNADFLNNLGTVLRDTGRLEEAVATYEKVLAVRPDFFAARANMALAQKELGRFDEAVEAWRATVAMKPYAVDARRKLAETLRDAGRPAEAAEAYREALSLKSRDAELCYGLGVALMEKGDIEAAVDAFRAAVGAQPDHAEAWLMLASLKRHKTVDTELEALEGAHDRAPTGSRERALTAFGLGKAYDDLGDFSRAFDFFEEANAAHRKSLSYDAAEVRAQFEAARRVFQPELFEKFAGSGDPDDTPVFVVGMPRSGTTLVEQIISSHPAVYGAGELVLLRSIMDGLYPPGATPPYPASVPVTPAEALRKAGRDYAEAIRAQYPGWRHVTDKMPGNFMLIGMIRLMLPNARIVHCARDARATCLSIFKTYFRNGHSYAYDLAELAEFHNLYTGMMEHWRQVLPGVVHDVRYEDFVADQEGQSRALIAHLGLPWDDAVLAFHKSERPVKTASAGQVRQPMYKGSTDLWKRYGDRLAPLASRLRDAS